MKVYNYIDLYEGVQRAHSFLRENNDGERSEANPVLERLRKGVQGQDGHSSSTYFGYPPPPSPRWVWLPRGLFFRNDPLIFRNALWMYVSVHISRYFFLVFLYTKWNCRAMLCYTKRSSVLSTRWHAWCQSIQVEFKYFQHIFRLKLALPHETASSGYFPVFLLVKFVTSNT